MINKRDIKLMEMLRRVAIDTDSGTRAQLAAAVVFKNNVISIGHNQMKSHPLQAKYSKNSEAIYLHAEINALHKSLKHISLEDIAKSTIYVARVKYSDKRKNIIDGNATPCKGCQRAIEEFGFKRVVYSTNVEGIYGESE